MLQYQQPVRYFLLSTLCLSFFAFGAFAQKNPRNIELHWHTDTSKRKVNLDEFTALLPRDGIPPIDEPRYWQADEALKNLFAHEPVIAYRHGGEARAFPLSILMYHEIVNDRVGGRPISVTYCPLCNAALIFHRRLEWQGKHYLLDFGVSGMLRHSDLVMWDRQTESWWQQLTGGALVGQLSGAELEVETSQVISLQEFLGAHPAGLVLSRQTGHDFEYGHNPYKNYDKLENQQPRLFKSEVDRRLPAMERVLDIAIGGKRKIYPHSTVAEQRVINDRFGGEPLVLFHTRKTVSVLDQSEIEKSKEIGSISAFSRKLAGKELDFYFYEGQFIDRQTQSQWSITGQCIAGPMRGAELRMLPHGNHFAFAWLNFYPESEIYRSEASPE